MNTLFLLGIGWYGEPTSDSRYWVASILAFILTVAFVLLFRRTVGRPPAQKEGPKPPAKPLARRDLSSRRDGSGSRPLPDERHWAG